MPQRRAPLALTALLGSLAAGGCAHRASTTGVRDATTTEARPASEAAKDEAPNVDRKTIVERLPDGTVRTTTVTTKTTRVEAPPPPPRPSDPLPPDPLVRFNLELLNRYRADAGIPPLVYDSAISKFAADGSKQLAADHRAHAHFQAKVDGAKGFGTHYSENQGDPAGVLPMDADPVKSGRAQIALLLKLMFDEGPGGGHHDNMLSPKYRRVGVGLANVGGRFFLTNDFSD